MGYSLELVSSLPRPLRNVESDGRALGSDIRHHIREMTFLNGSESVEYGGESPWIHEWRGTIEPDSIPESWVGDTASFEERVKRIVENLMTFFDDSCTPHNTSASDFEWTVRVHEENSSLRPDGVYSIQIVWKPKD